MNFNSKFQVGNMVCNSYEEAIAYFKFMHKLTGVILGIVEIK